jgi:chromosome segregation ATPase
VGSGYAKIHEELDQAKKNAEDTLQAYDKQSQMLDHSIFEKQRAITALKQELEALNRETFELNTYLDNLTGQLHETEQTRSAAERLMYDVQIYLNRTYQRLNYIENKARHNQRTFSGSNPCLSSRLASLAAFSSEAKQRLAETMFDLVVPDVTDLVIWLAPVKRATKAAMKFADFSKTIYDHWLVDCI